MVAKFKIGDKVRLTGHEVAIITGKAKKPHFAYKNVLHTPNPESLKLIDRNRTRTITKIIYNPKRRRNKYFLGDNRKGKSPQLSTVPFDSTQLTLITHKRGRPRQKRQYIRHLPYS